MHKTLIFVIFWALIIVFLVILSAILIPSFRGSVRGPRFGIIIGLAFFLLGLLLVIFTLKEKRIEGKLKRFLLLTGGSATSFFISVLLHNLFYGLEVMSSSIKPLSYLMVIFHTTFFIIAVFICPITFLIGLVEAIFFARNAKLKTKHEKD